MVTKRFLSFFWAIVFLSSLFYGLDAMKSKSFTEQLESLERRRDHLAEKIEKLEEADGKVKNAKLITSLTGRLTTINTEIDTLLESGGQYDWLARCMAGKENAEFLNGVNPSGHLGAIGYGFAAQGAGAVGNFMSTKMKSTMDTLFGGIWDWCIVRLTKLFNSEKFDIPLLNMWQFKFVDKLEVINAILSKGFGDSMRLMDQTSRQYDDASAQSGSAAVVTQVDEVWMAFVKDTVSDYNVFIALVEESREDYSKESPPIIPYLDAIIQLLRLVFDPLSKSTSTRDFDNKLGPTKSCIMTVMKSVQNYFKQLCDILKTRNQLINKLAPTQTTPAQQNNYRSYPGDNGFSSQPFSQQA